MTSTEQPNYLRAAESQISAGAAALGAEFAELPTVRIAQAIARAKIEINTGYLMLAISPPSAEAFADEVVGLARQELERATDRMGRAGQPLGG